VRQGGAALSNRVLSAGGVAAAAVAVWMAVMAAMGVAAVVVAIAAFRLAQMATPEPTAEGVAALARLATLVGTGSGRLAPCWYAAGAASATAR
jgi:hypothetical protein